MAPVDETERIFYILHQARSFRSEIDDRQAPTALPDGETQGLNFIGSLVIKRTRSNLDEAPRLALTIAELWVLSTDNLRLRYRLRWRDSCNQRRLTASVQPNLDSRRDFPRPS